MALPIPLLPPVTMATRPVSPRSIWRILRGGFGSFSEGPIAWEVNDADPPIDRWRVGRAALAAHGQHPRGPLRGDVLGAVRQARGAGSPSAPGDDRPRVRPRSPPARPGGTVSGGDPAWLRRHAGDGRIWSAARVSGAEAGVRGSRRDHSTAPARRGCRAPREHVVRAARARRAIARALRDPARAPARRKLPLA